MATGEPAVPVNGAYTGPGFDASAANYSAVSANSAVSVATGYTGAHAAPASAANPAATSDIPKDEVGWYFVEQYYTTLSKHPDKLFLFYNKRSQFVSGTEEDKIPVSLGQKAINERIKELEFQDCKVRVTNVDSQGSDAHIVIQVIGEISNKGQPHKRFVQTFVLAEQTNGYFVLNDIFRFLADEAEVEEQLPGPVAGIQEPAPTAAPGHEEKNQSSEIATTEEDMVKIDHKVENVMQQDKAVNEPAGEPVASESAASEPAAEPLPAPVALNGATAAEIAEPAAEAVPDVSSTAVEAESETAASDVLEAEKPKDPAPTPAPAAVPAAAPAAVPAAAPAAAPAAPPSAQPTSGLSSVAPAKRTWANLAASANKVATPVATPIVPQAPAPKPAAVKPLAVPPPTAAPVHDPSPATSHGESAGWQTAGAPHKKEQTRTTNHGLLSDGENSRRAYIKNVWQHVSEEHLRETLIKYGDVEYLDINRTKNCAFVDFRTTAGFQNAVGHNPHVVDGSEVRVEERLRRPTMGSYRGGPRGRGSMGGPSRGYQPRGGRGGSMGRGSRVAVET